MNFIYAGDFRLAHSTEGYIAKALVDQGHTVHLVNEYRGGLLSEISDITRQNYDKEFVFLFCKLQRPNFPFREACNDPTPVTEILRKIRYISGISASVCWVFDLMRAEFNSGRYRWAEAVSQVTDLFITTDSELGIGECIRQGYPGPIALPPPGRDRFKPKVDFLFLGSIYGERKPWYRNLREKFGDRLRIIQDGTHCDNLFNLMRSVRVVIGPDWPNFPGYWSNRLYLVTGYGGFLACPYVEGMFEEGWNRGDHYHAIDSTSKYYFRELEAIAKDEEYRTQVIRNARRLVTENLTMGHRVKELTNLIQQRGLGTC